MRPDAPTGVNRHANGSAADAVLLSWAGTAGDGRGADVDEAAAVDEERRSRVDRTARLVEFLRDLARRRTPPVLDVEREPLVRWLGDLPAGVDVLSDGSPGEVLLRLEKLQGEPPPEVPLALLGWVRTDDVEDSDLPRLPLLLGSKDAAGPHDGGRGAPSVVAPPEVVAAHAAFESRWRVWAEQDRTTRVQRDWDARLSEAQHRLSQQDDELELVLAVGLLGWRPPGHDAVRSHLLTTPCRLELDGATGSLVVRVGEDAAVRLRDRDLLDGTPGVSEAPAVRERLRSEPPPLLSDAVKDVLLQWQTLALATSRPYAHVWDRLPHAGATPELRLAPALVLRKRDAGPLLAYYDSMLEVLQGADVEAPLGLVQLVEAVSAEQRLAMLEAGGASPASVVGAEPLFPLPANQEQRQIVDRLRQDNGVVVQGPPGTGKTHTIANLVSALLAQGQRVLVTSQKAQALSVLRDKLPDAVQELCVSLTEPGRGGATELARSVNAMSGRFTTYDRERHAAQVTALQEAREQARRRVAGLREEVRALREAETFRHPEVAAGYGGTAAAIAERLAAGTGRVDWVPVPVPAGDAAPPLPVGEAAELHHLLATSTDGRRARAEQVLPDVAGLPTSAEVRRQLATEQAAAEAARQTRTEVSSSLRLLGPEDLSALECLAADARAAQHALGLPEDGTAWPADDWRVGALAEGLAGRDTSILEELWQHGGDARARLDALAGTGLRTVVAPEPTPTGHGSLAGQVAAARGLADYLGSGGQLRKMFRPAVQKAAEQLLAEATVDGLPPTSPELLGAVLAHLEGELTATTLAGAWASVGVPSAIGVPLRARLGALADRHGDLGHVRVVLAARREVAALCARLGARPHLGTPSGWTTFLRDLSAVRLRVEAEEASRATDERAERLRLMSRAPGAPPELATLAHATAARDVDAYEQALAALAAAPAEQVQQRRCDALLARVADAHPLLAASLRSTAHDPRWAERLPGWEEAWAWAVARTFFDRQRQPGRDTRLERDLGEAVARVEALTGDLAAAWAWGYCLERMTAEQVQALRAYQDATSKIGAGTGKYVHRYRRAARDAMDVAREAVPAWVLPLARVLETIPPGKDSFDVVIVDEASQASLESLFLLWLAPRVIVVGDDKQCAPSEISHGALDPIFARLDAQLSFLPTFLRVALGCCPLGGQWLHWGSDGPERERSPRWDDASFRRSTATKRSRWSSRRLGRSPTSRVTSG